MIAGRHSLQDIFTRDQYLLINRTTWHRASFAFISSDPDYMPHVLSQ